MKILSIQSQRLVTLESDLYRVNCILDVIVHLYPESSENFDYEDEILALISVARDMLQVTRNQLGEGWEPVASDVVRSNAGEPLPENRAAT